MKIALVVPVGSNSTLAISGASTIFHMARAYGLPVDYRILSAGRSQILRIDPFTLTADGTTRDAGPLDLIVLPSVVGDPEQSIAQNRHLIGWLRSEKESGARIASLCTGAYLLAETGLLDGLEASSHCSAIDDLKARFPRVIWAPDKIITDAHGLYTSGGTLSSFNVLIYLLGKYFDKQIAHRIARFIQLDYPRTTQKPFYIVANQKNHTDEQILAVQAFLEDHVAGFVNLNEVAREFGMSRRSLNRRFKAATGDSPRTYIQRIKVEQVKQWLESEDVSISEAISRIGYSDENAFRNVFKKMTGMLPSDYRQRFGLN